MEQHPVPQQISSYEFRLVGDMTLKQFFQLAGGVVIALIIYASGLPSYFKWPLIIFFGCLGAAMAFLPFEERPLQTWIIAFFKAVYSPTQFLWQKKPKKPEFLEPRPARPSKLVTVPVTQDRGKLVEYLQTLPVQKSLLDQKEEGFLKQVTNLFSLTSLPQGIQVEAKPLEEAEEPAGIRIRRLGVPFVEKEEPPRLAPVEEVQPRAAGITFGDARQVVPIPGYTPQKPFLKPTRLRPPGYGGQAKPAELAPESLFPSVPSIPNILVGIVKDREEKIVEGAIMEIRDEQGNPVRALRTNKLGQFRIATPLPSGTYDIETEKEGLDFDIVKITLRGEIIQPIEIKAK
ncbi:MAG: hypothetical protein ACOZBZ_00855 [Patescibacteria group bacterium]